MTIKKEYLCDLCKRPLQPCDRKWVGIIWKPGGLFHKSFDRQFDHGSDVNHHLCYKCLESATNIWKEIGSPTEENKQRILDNEIPF